MKIVFWHLFISPHMINLANKLAELGNTITYVVETRSDKDRLKLGWKSEIHTDITLLCLEDISLHEVLNTVDLDAHHIVEGLRNNSYIQELMIFFKKNNIYFWPILETINDEGWKGKLRRLLYKAQLRKFGDNIKGILAIGHETGRWFEKIGVKKNKIFPFTYFLEPSIHDTSQQNQKFIFIFCGVLTNRKRPELILRSLYRLQCMGRKDFELWVVGSGELEEDLKSLNKKLNIPIKWFGYQDINVVRSFIAVSDCLLLPSLSDGWGAVVSEAIIEGTPAICSNSCGSAGILLRSPFGSTFETHNENQFYDKVLKHYERGSINPQQRSKLKMWGTCLTTDSGANYLINILKESHNLQPPWI